MIESINKNEYLLFALCGRSLLELTASLRYHTKDLLPIIEDSAKTGFVTTEQQNMIIKNLDRHIRGGRFNWHEFHYGDRNEFAAQLVEERKRKDKKQNNNISSSEFDKINPEQINIQTAINKWGKDEPGVLLTYDYFCELVHPNLGSNFLVMGTKSNDLIIGKSSPKDVAKNISIEGIKMIASTAIREGSKYMAVLILLKEKDNIEPLNN